MDGRVQVANGRKVHFLNLNEVWAADIDTSPGYEKVSVSTMGGKGVYEGDPAKALIVALTKFFPNVIEAPPLKMEILS